ncbi:MAG: hypothetical protein J5752_10355 [Clostridiales bacterium]|nr:hypothetical protein [Clostridiales bacterium]
MTKNIVFKLSIVLLLFSVLIVGYVFICTDAEYNLNQQIARGYISRDALFFNIVDLSQPTARWGWTDFDPETGEMTVVGNVAVSESDGTLTFDYTPIDPVDPSFVLTNPLLSDGSTAVESILSSGKGAYFSSLHNGTLRAVYYQGDTSTVPLTSGRFFSSEECLQDEPLAVIGRNVSDSVYKENGETYYDYLGRKYQVIGTCGLTGPSSLDSLVFVNLGSLSPEEQLNGMFYIDNTRSAESIFKTMNATCLELLHTKLAPRRTPTALIDTVSGGMYLKEYLKASIICLFLFFSGSIAIQIVRRQSFKVAIMRLCGISFSKILQITGRELLIWGGIGLLLGTSLIAAFVANSLFSLSVSFVVSTACKLILLDICLLVLLLLVIAISEYLINPKNLVAKV